MYSTSVAMLLTAMLSVFLFGFHLSLAVFLGSTWVFMLKFHFSQHSHAKSRMLLEHEWMNSKCLTNVILPSVLSPSQYICTPLGSSRDSESYSFSHVWVVFANADDFSSFFSFFFFSFHYLFLYPSSILQIKILSYAIRPGPMWPWTRSFFQKSYPDFG